ncbi:peptidase C60 sortase A and B [Kribbella flavida DSM 17836]|uniref:Peptidase C60 sortase A and B n=1 Tax=Kribbella flavida (strain DSM 17836 / JCM 10339 / NBRC 14399) TaxID=479435 RepID=D2PXG1_KRIFD|nr:class F sortase [Kribbella flavida]ADB29809.1 peptidase C60 sortase A and B [Kribbella flavida DSM 17836]
MALEGCAAQQDEGVSSAEVGGGTTVVSPPAGPQAGTPVPPARVGTPAASQRIRFVPTEVVLPGGAKAPVLPASTVDGRLVVPERVQRVGWWDGGAQAGDPFGATVLAGHVDSATDGIGYFVRLLRIRVGETVVLRGGGHSAAYRVSSVVSVPKDALATQGRAFEQTGEHRLSLITCTGTYDAARGGYSANLLVTALPLGLAQ